MARRTIVILPGDGIGKVVLPEAVRVLEAVGFDADYVHGDIGWAFWVEEGDPLPQRTLDLIDEHKIALFGAITSKPKEAAAAELSPGLRGRGLIYYSPIVDLRQRYGLDVSIRPCRSFRGNPLNFIRREGDGFVEPDIDTVVFRQNTEGLYCGVEWTRPPGEIRAALETHPRMAAFRDVPDEDLAVSARIFSRQACRRIGRAAFDHARKFGYASVTICEKPNVIRETSGMLTAEVRAAGEDYPDIAVRETNIDAQMMWLTKNPEDFGVLVAGNMFGDIVSDGFAGLVGGLGFACSANIGEAVAVFEPTHGSAPKYEDLDPPIVNPIAMILSACMMLDHIGETDRARRIRGAVGDMIAEGKVRAYDMLRLAGGPDVLTRGAASTTQITDAILARI